MAFEPLKFILFQTTIWTYDKLLIYLFYNRNSVKNNRVKALVEDKVILRASCLKLAVCLLHSMTRAFKCILLLAMPTFTYHFWLKIMCPLCVCVHANLTGIVEKWFIFCLIIFFFLNNSVGNYREYET